MFDSTFRLVCACHFAWRRLLVPQSIISIQLSIARMTDPILPNESEGDDESSGSRSILEKVGDVEEESKDNSSVELPEA